MRTVRKIFEQTTYNVKKVNKISVEKRATSCVQQCHVLRAFSRVFTEKRNVGQSVEQYN